MPVKDSDTALKKLIEANIKTQESVSAVVSSVKSLISELRKAAEMPDEELKFSNTDELKAISAKLDKVLQQNEQLLKAVHELADSLKLQMQQQPSQQSLPLGYRRL
ncbi:MAG: hypothetical protein QW063_01685 [Candidatus Nanoarchaeia archaeon]